MATKDVSAAFESITLNGPEPTSFPAPTKYTAGAVNGVPTGVSAVHFADKIVVTITQGGRLSQWIQVPLSTASPTSFETTLPALGEDLLPQGHLNPKTLIGAGGEQREAIGHLYATQLANSILTRNPEENRSVLVGLGLTKIDMERAAFFDMMELLHKII